MKDEKRLLIHHFWDYLEHSTGYIHESAWPSPDESQYGSK